MVGALLCCETDTLDARSCSGAQPAQFLAEKGRLVYSNETEASFYTLDGESTEQALTCLFKLGIANVILKRGSKGVILATVNGIREVVDAFRVNALDTTAAGDAFNGAFAVSLMRGNPVFACQSERGSCVDGEGRCKGFWLNHKSPNDGERQLSVLRLHQRKMSR